MGKSGTALATSALGLLLQAALLLASGAVLSIKYLPSIEGAHRSAEFLRMGGVWDALERYHYWGSLILLLHAFLHLTVMLWAGIYKPPNVWLWIGAVTLAVTGFLFQVTGNLLPMDRHAVQTAVIEAGIARRVPLIGSEARQIMLSGTTFSRDTLSTWYSAHKWVLPALLVVGTAGMAAGLFKRRRWSPDWLGAAMPVIASIILCVIYATPSGPQALSIDANSYDSGPNWYTWPMHGLLAMFDAMGQSFGWLGAALIPGLLLLYLLFLPLWSKKLSDGGVRLIYVVFLGVIGAATVFYGGPFPSPLTRQIPPLSAPPRSRPAAFVDAKLAQKGKELFAAEGCTGCHGIDGSPSDSAPDLTLEHQKHPDADWYVRFMHDPKSLKPNTTMPAFPQLTVYQRKALAEYLRHPRKATGNQ